MQDRYTMLILSSFSEHMLPNCPLFVNIFVTFVCDVLPPPEVVSWSYLLVFNKDPFKGQSPVMFMQRGKHNFLFMPFHAAETFCNLPHNFFF
jgi:hypothetical protein